MKMKYDESDNTLIRATRVVTDKVTDLIGTWHLTHSNSAIILMWINYSLMVSAFYWVRYLIAWAGGLFSKTEMSEVLTEILRADPSFDKDSFLRQCERDIIPNILEVILVTFFCYFLWEILEEGFTVYWLRPLCSMPTGW